MDLVWPLAALIKRLKFLIAGLKGYFNTMMHIKKLSTLLLSTQMASTSLVRQMMPLSKFGT
jgi:hypothetical protein